MLNIKEIDNSGIWYISLNGECIHGGIYSKLSALSYLKTYQKVWEDGYMFSKSEGDDK